MSIGPCFFNVSLLGRRIQDVQSWNLIPRVFGPTTLTVATSCLNLSFASPAGSWRWTWPLDLQQHKSGVFGYTDLTVAMRFYTCRLGWFSPRWRTFSNHSTAGYNKRHDVVIYCLWDIFNFLSYVKIRIGTPSRKISETPLPSIIYYIRAGKRGRYPRVVLGSETFNMTYEWLVDIFVFDCADTCRKHFSLMLSLDSFRVDYLHIITSKYFAC